MYVKITAQGRSNESETFLQEKDSVPPLLTQPQFKPLGLRRAKQASQIA